MAEVADNMVIAEDSVGLQLCPCGSDVVVETCSLGGNDTHRMCGMDTKETYLEILCFRQFYKHFVFTEDGDGNRNKRLEKYFEVSAVVDVGCEDTNGK